MSKAPSQQSLADVLCVIEGIAMNGMPVPLYQRVASSETGWWLDLGDASGDAVRVSAEGWRISLPPVRFRRTVLTSALPRPVPGGHLDELWSLLNVSERDRP